MTNSNVLSTESTHGVRQPLLSICIPTYNGAPYLGHVLRALLPQAAAVGVQVEVLVVDDCSTAQTAQIVADAQRWGPMRFIRNETNVGMAQNIVNCLTKHASGQYVWIWSQHCLLHFDALARVLMSIQQNQSLDAFYVNFRCARYPADWPDLVEGGYAGAFEYISNADEASHTLDSWESLLNVRTALCTQTYAHILRKSLAVAYWQGKSVGREYGNGPDTFSQTATVATSMFGKPCFYVGEPVFTIFNGAQTWGALKQRARVYLQGLPDLVRIYQRLGWASQPLKEAQTYSSRKAGEVILELLQDPNNKEARRILHFIFHHGNQKDALRSAWGAFVASQCCWPARAIHTSSATLSRWHRYWFYNCRPARWLRSGKHG